MDGADVALWGGYRWKVRKGRVGEERMRGGGRKSTMGEMEGSDFVRREHSMKVEAIIQVHGSLYRWHPFFVASNVKQTSSQMIIRYGVNKWP